MEVANVLGTSLEVTRFYGDGSYDCPHCQYAIRADEGLGPCRNPWCIANPLMTPDAARTVLAKRDAALREESERKRNHAASMARIAEWKETSERKRTAKLNDAREQGYCIRCLVKSDFRKQVRHRLECPLTR